MCGNESMLATRTEVGLQDMTTAPSGPINIPTPQKLDTVDATCRLAATCTLVLSGAVIGFYSINDLPPITRDPCEYTQPTCKAARKEREAR